MGSANGKYAADGKYAAVDVYYPASGGARAALVLSDDPAFAESCRRKTVVVPHAAPYRPGRFFERELPPLLRGQATRPLYVTAAGLAAADAAELIRGMSGPFRLPDALRLADALSRGRAV